MSLAYDSAKGRLGTAASSKPPTILVRASNVTPPSATVSNKSVSANRRNGTSTQLNGKHGKGLDLRRLSISSWSSSSSSIGSPPATKEGSLAKANGNMLLRQNAANGDRPGPSTVVTPLVAAAVERHNGESADSLNNRQHPATSYAEERPPAVSILGFTPPPQVRRMESDEHFGTYYDRIPSLDVDEDDIYSERENNSPGDSPSSARELPLAEQNGDAAEDAKMTTVVTEDIVVSNSTTTVTSITQLKEEQSTQETRQETYRNLTRSISTFDAVDFAIRSGQIEDTYDDDAGSAIVIPDEDDTPQNQQTADSRANDEIPDDLSSISIASSHAADQFMGGCKTITIRTANRTYFDSLLLDPNWTFEDVLMLAPGLQYDRKPTDVYPKLFVVPSIVSPSGEETTRISVRAVELFATQKVVETFPQANHFTQRQQQQQHPAWSAESTVSQGSADSASPLPSQAVQQHTAGLTHHLSLRRPKRPTNRYNDSADALSPSSVTLGPVRPRLQSLNRPMATTSIPTPLSPTSAFSKDDMALPSSQFSSKEAYNAYHQSPIRLDSLPMRPIVNSANEPQQETSSIKLKPLAKNILSSLNPNLSNKEAAGTKRYQDLQRQARNAPLSPPSSNPLSPQDDVDPYTGQMKGAYMSLKKLNEATERFDHERRANTMPRLGNRSSKENLKQSFKPDELGGSQSLNRPVAGLLKGMRNLRMTLTRSNSLGSSSSPSNSGSSRSNKTTVSPQTLQSKTLNSYPSNPVSVTTRALRDSHASISSSASSTSVPFQQPQKLSEVMRNRESMASIFSIADAVSGPTADSGVFDTSIVESAIPEEEEETPLQVNTAAHISAENQKHSPPATTPKSFGSRPSSLLASIESVIAQHQLLASVVGETPLLEESIVATDLKFPSSSPRRLSLVDEDTPSQTSSPVSANHDETLSYARPPQDDVSPDSSGVSVDKNGKQETFFKRLLRKASTTRLGRKKKDSDVSPPNSRPTTPEFNGSSMVNDAGSVPSKGSLEVQSSSISQSSASKGSLSFKSSDDGHNEDVDDEPALALIMPRTILSNRDSSYSTGEDGYDSERNGAFDWNIEGGNPEKDMDDLFSPTKKVVSTQEKLEAMIIHSELAEQLTSMKLNGMINSPSRIEKESTGGTLSRRAGIIFPGALEESSGSAQTLAANGEQDSDNSIDEGRNSADLDNAKLDSRGTEAAVSKLNDIMGALIREGDAKRATLIVELQMLDMESVLDMDHRTSQASIKTLADDLIDSPIRETPKVHRVVFSDTPLLVEGMSATIEGDDGNQNSKKKNYAALRASVPPGSLDPVLLDKLADLSTTELINSGSDGFDVLLARLENCFTAALRSGPKTIFFWAPTMKWGIVLAGLSDLNRPVEKLSFQQNFALAATGCIWARYATVITPINYNLMAVNIFVGASGLYQLARIWKYEQSKKSGEVAAKKA
ncbi:Mitochondrial pyruvate carrier 2 [Chytridiales sp. JEL 0842]|nr:Mitochondrial pyruvate carrier 2 [Chytridiales sp. JEL 0842]